MWKLLWILLSSVIEFEFSEFFDTMCEKDGVRWFLQEIFLLMMKKEIYF